MHSRYIVLPLVLILLLTSFVAITADAARPVTPNSLPIALVPQDSTTLTAVADATVKNWQPTSNFGSDATLELSYSNIDAVQRAVSLVKFDLSTLPSDAIIDSATLQLYLDSTAGASPVNIGVYFVTSSWNESTVTWNTFPTANSVGINGSVDSSAGYKSWSVTSYARSWLSGSNYGVYLSGPTNTYFGRTFKSHEGRIYPPQLSITYHRPCSSDPYEPNDSLGTAANATPGSAQQGYICPSGDDDYFKYSVSSGQQMQIDLDGAGGSNLPADYDIELYAPDQSYVTQSNNGATTPENITYTADQSGTWYVRVLGYNGAYDSSNPYRLRITLSLTATPTPTATPSNIISFNLCAVADSTIDEANPADNLGDASTLRVGYGAGQNEPFASRSLVRFDLSFIPPGTQVQSATFETRLIQADNATPFDIFLYDLQDPWEEMTVTWQNQPLIATPFVTRIPVNISLGSVYAWDVKGLVQKWIDDEPQNRGLALRGPEGGAAWVRVFDSRHYTPFCPRLSLQLRPTTSFPTPTSTPPPTATPTPTPACSQIDAGNSFQQATTLTPDGSWNYEYICPSGDVDWWQFSADDHQEITIHLGGMPQAPPADYDLFLINPSGGQIASSELWGASKDEYINITVYQKGNYRVLVRGKGVADWSNKTPYQLSVETKYECIDPNDAGDYYTNAAAITPSLPQANVKHVTYGYICPQGDKDMYKFVVSGGQNVLIWAKLTELPADYQLILYGPIGQLLGLSNSSGTSDEQVLYAAIDKPGTYYAFVQGATTSSYHAQPYKLEVSLSGTADLVVQGIEVTQVIQDLNNSVALVIGKPAIARVYVGAGGIVHGPISGVSVTLRAWTAGWRTQKLGELVLGPSTRPNGVLNDAKRGNYNSSYNFVLPKSWLGGGPLRLEAEVNLPLEVPETIFSNNKMTTKNIGVRSTAPLNVGLVPVRASNLTPSLHNNTLMTNMIAYLRAVFPAVRINMWYKKGGPLDANYNYIMPAKGCGDGWVDLLDDLEDIYDDWENRPAHAFVYGLLNSGVPPGPGHGCGRYGEPIAAGMLDPNSGTIIAHEMGHNFGRKHAPIAPGADPNYPSYTNAQGTPYPSGSIGQVGLNASTHQTFNPSRTFDLMSYSSPAWFSPYNYTAILSRMPFGVTAARATQKTPHIIVSGNIKDGQIDLRRPFWVRDREDGAYSDSGEGSYSIVLKNASGDTLFERRFEPPTEFIGADHNSDHFHEILPYPPGTAAIVFTHQGQVLRTVSISAHAPVVQVLSPNGGENWPDAGPYTIRWQASDADGDDLTAVVLYSADGGATWEPLAVNLKTTELQVQAGDLPGGNDNLVRVLVSDGVNTSHDDSDSPFTVSDKAPLALIIQPPSGVILYPEQPVILQGVASDPEEGPLPDEQMQWTSDRDGALGEGADLAVPELSAGIHRITLSATDSQGHTGQTSITVIVGRSPYLPLVMQN